MIVRDIGALPEVVHDSGGGFVYRTDEELVTYMTQIAASPRLRRQLGEQGYDAFLRYWSREAHMELYYQFLQRAATKRFGYVPWETGTESGSEGENDVQLAEASACG